MKNKTHKKAVASSQPIKKKKKKKGAPFSRLPDKVLGRTTRSLSITDETRRLLREAGDFIYAPDRDRELNNNEYVRASNLIIQAACEAILREPPTHLVPIGLSRPVPRAVKLWPVAFDARAESDDECAVKMLLWRMDEGRMIAPKSRLTTAPSP